MILFLEVGNTNIVAALSDGEKIIYTWRIITETINSPKDFETVIFQLFNLNFTETPSIETVVFSSVVSRFDGLFEEFCLKNKMKILSLKDKNIKIDFETKAENPSEVGEDIICNIIAGKKIFEENFIVIDMGTATTFDIAGKNGVHIGEVIVPGAKIMSKSLKENCDLLNDLTKIDYQPTILALNTEMAINAGIFYGYVGLIKEIIARIKKEYGEEMKVCLTGGMSNVFMFYLDFIENVFPNLTIMGLMEIWKENKNRLK